MHLFLTWGPRGLWIDSFQGVHDLGCVGGDYNFIFTNL